jgi:hypothetical protein
LALIAASVLEKPVELRSASLTLFGSSVSWTNVDGHQYCHDISIPGIPQK